MSGYLDIKNKEKKFETGKYLAIRFFIVVIFIFFTSHMIELLMQKFLLPLVSNSFFSSPLVFEGNPILIVIKIFGYIIFGSLIERIPSPFADMVKAKLMPLTGTSIRVPAAVTQSGKISVAMYFLTLILLVLLLLLISLLPYILGGGWFIYEINRKVKELIEEDRRQKEEFEKKRNLLLADIAHDIKTPITAMSGYAKAISDGLVAEEKEQEYLNTIYSKSMRVSELIDMMFEYIKLDSAEYKLNICSYDLAELSREVIASIYQDFEDAGLDLDIDIPEEEMMYDMDKNQLSRVIYNLLSNALKYTKRGNRILFKVEKEAPSYSGRTYKVVVADTDAPIDEEFAKYIFDPFARGDTSRSSAGGTGLGLSIAHRIVALHDGDLTLNAEYGQGYTKAFEISL